MKSSYVYSEELVQHTYQCFWRSLVGWGRRSSLQKVKSLENLALGAGPDCTYQHTPPSLSSDQALSECSIEELAVKSCYESSLSSLSPLKSQLLSCSAKAVALSSPIPNKVGDAERCFFNTCLSMLIEISKKGSFRSWTPSSSPSKAEVVMELKIASLLLLLGGSDCSFLVSLHVAFGAVSLSYSG